MYGLRLKSKVSAKKQINLNELLIKVVKHPGRIIARILLIDSFKYPSVSLQEINAKGHSSKSKQGCIYVFEPVCFILIVCGLEKN